MTTPVQTPSELVAVEHVAKLAAVIDTLDAMSASLASNAIAEVGIPTEPRKLMDRINQTVNVWRMEANAMKGQIEATMTPPPAGPGEP